MRPANSSKHVAIIVTEIAWLLGSWAFSYVVLGMAVGFNYLAAGPLDIQMHNTYFVLSTGYAVFPIFILVATVVTVVRGVVAGFKHNSIKVVLGLLASVWALLLFALFFILSSHKQLHS
jgi:hypothetical protein